MSVHLEWPMAESRIYVEILLDFEMWNSDMFDVLALDETAARGHYVNLLIIMLHFSKIIPMLNWNEHSLIQWTLLYPSKCKIMAECT